LKPYETPSGQEFTILRWRYANELDGRFPLAEEMHCPPMYDIGGFVLTAEDNAEYRKANRRRFEKNRRKSQRKSVINRRRRK
jgi:hypothetical protein